MEGKELSDGPSSNRNGPTQEMKIAPTNKAIATKVVETDRDNCDQHFVVTVGGQVVKSETKDLGTGV